MPKNTPITTMQKSMPIAVQFCSRTCSMTRRRIMASSSAARAPSARSRRILLLDHGEQRHEALFHAAHVGEVVVGVIASRRHGGAEAPILARGVEVDVEL